jgi:crotonobetainyl-CoA:carnitine CoA-transferase CaiB-like acyl-CoA transferase
MAGPLEGIRVIDIASGVAGAMATMVLSDQGADVIQVEPVAGNPLRRYPGSVVWHRGKRSIVLDLEDVADRDRLLDLLRTADVLVEGFAPGRLGELGIDSGAFAETHPGLLHVSVTAYGPVESLADRPGHDLLVQARSGQQYEQPGWREGPIFLYAPLPSLGTSYLILLAVGAGLFAREVTGRGQHVETSLYQGVLSFTTQLWHWVERDADQYWDIPMNPQAGIFECSDGAWVHSMHNSGGRGKDKRGFFDFLGIDEPSTSVEPAIMARTEQALRAAFKRFPREEILAAARANDVAMAPVLRAHEGLRDEQVAATGLAVEVIDPEHGPTTQVGPTFTLHGAPSPGVQGPAPALDQHREEILSELDSADRRTVEPRPAKRPHTFALDGIKILDLGNFLAGPFGPMLLGDLGATVYKLESPEGDQMRPIDGPFNGCQRGKIDVAVDLKTPEGIEIARRLIREVDVVHHNMRPGVAERLGIDYQTAKTLNPEVIYCQTTMWGLDGPRRDWPGFDQLGQATSGCEVELGGAGNPPVWYRFGMCDQACAFQSAAAVLLALYWREKTGRGQFVDTSILAGGMYLNSDVWIGPQGPHIRPALDPGQMGIGPLYRLYPTADGWLALAVTGDAEWAALCRALPELADDARFANSIARRDHEEALTTFLEARLESSTAGHWFDVLDAAGVPVEIADSDAGTRWLHAPELDAAGLIADYPLPRWGRLRQFGTLIGFSETPGRIGGPPPLLGEHSREVLHHLGYDDEEIADLAARGVTTWPDR